MNPWPAPCLPMARGFGCAACVGGHAARCSHRARFRAGEPLLGGRRNQRSGPRSGAAACIATARRRRCRASDRRRAPRWTFAIVMSWSPEALARRARPPSTRCRRRRVPRSCLTDAEAERFPHCHNSQVKLVVGQAVRGPLPELRDLAPTRKRREEIRPTPIRLVRSVVGLRLVSGNNGEGGVVS
jgi:hypothetical protein